MTDIGKYEKTMKAIDLSDAPIVITEDGDLAIYRSEWANEVLSDPSIITGYSYFITSLSSHEVYPVNTNSEVHHVIMGHYSRSHQARHQSRDLLPIQNETK